MALKHLPVFLLTILLITVAGLPRSASSYAEVQQDARPVSTPVPASLDVTLVYPSDGVVRPGMRQVVRASITIGPPAGTPTRNYLVVTKISDTAGTVVRTHAYHPKAAQSMGQVSMLHVPPGDYTFSTELYSAGTMVAQSGSSNVTKTPRRAPKSSPTPTPTATVAPTSTPTIAPTATPTPAPTSTPSPAPSGSATPVAGYATTWAANNFSGGGYADVWTTTSASKPFVQNVFGTIAVTDAGKVFATNWYDEAHLTNGIYQNGAVIGRADCNPNSGHGGGFAAAANSTFVWLADYEWTSGNYVMRFDQDGNRANWSGGGGCGNKLTVDASITDGNAVFGMAASSTELYVADEQQQKILVYNANTMQPARSWNFAHPRRIAYDPHTDSLWIGQGGANVGNFVGSVCRYSTSGASLSTCISGVGIPMALAMNGSELWVADAGPDQNIKRFNTSGTLVGTFGAAGGYLSGTPGVHAEGKLFMPNGLGFDSNGNVYVSSGVYAGNYDKDLTVGANGQSPLNGMVGALYEYDSAGSLLWHLGGRSFVNGVAIDAATDGQDLYTTVDHIKMDYSRLSVGAGGGGTEWSWYSTTIDPVHYPYDPRIGSEASNFRPTAIAVRDIGGYKYLFVQGHSYGKVIEVFRMNGEIAVPDTVVSCRNFPTWTNLAPSVGFIWTDANGNGNPDSGEFTADSGGTWLNLGTGWCEPDNNGDLWCATFDSGRPNPGINKFTHSVDGYHNLNYSLSSATAYGIPAPFNRVQHATYDSATDVMYVSGATAAYPYNCFDGNDACAGPVFAAYPKWVGSGNRTAAYTIIFPTAGAGIRPWTVAGGKLFAGQFETGASPSQNIYVYDAGSGAFLGNMYPGAEVNAYMGWLDSNQPLQAFRRSNGEYVVVEEEEINSKVNILRGLLTNFTQF
jgi:hypothetical protein